MSIAIGGGGGGKSSPSELLTSSELVSILLLPNFADKLWTHDAKASCFCSFLSSPTEPLLGVGCDGFLGDIVVVLWAFWSVLWKADLGMLPAYLDEFVSCLLETELVRLGGGGGGTFRLLGEFWGCGDPFWLETATNTGPVGGGGKGWDIEVVGDLGDMGAFCILGWSYMWSDCPDFFNIAELMRKAFPGLFPNS